MANSYDSSAQSNNNGASSLTFSHTTAGDLLIVLVRDESGDHVTGVTYNGVAMTQLAKGVEPSATAEAYVYYLLSPALGANNIVISRSSSSNNLAGASASYLGTKQTGFPDGNASGGNTSGGGAAIVTSSVTVTANNSWVVVGASSNVPNGFVFSGSGTFNATTRKGGDNLKNLLLGDSNAPLSSGSQNVGITQGTSSSLIYFLISIASGVLTVSVLETSPSVDTLSFTPTYGVNLSETSPSADTLGAKGGIANTGKNNSTVTNTAKHNAVTPTNTIKHNSTFTNTQKS